MKLGSLVFVAGLLVVGRVNGQEWLTKWPTITSCICKTGYNANSALQFLKSCTLPVEPCANCFLACQREHMKAMLATGAVNVTFYTSRNSKLTAAQVQECDTPLANEKDKCKRAQLFDACLKAINPTCLSY
ncbi:hypothetical protein PPYR_09643 [Photinus pyralis]|uniref:Uncharacterized protein n=2 Tax=Photinus pyralis TaxID=7054 RepID=A0A5N4AMT1_PHOPY|nr:uncharacterized protein LOC116172612 [Photinus pyralis]XP_031345714.1 uncharacterized protein LOC116172614 [Photinus pyralis]KAB0797261.1 hypothetical protein PPYR_08255 [Photinus pyralis]KAB0798650.1 hypothetical protein PPYR_09643 [Photinus pyralis]